MTGKGIGASVKRREDFRFIKGIGKYTDDINLPNQVYCYFLRSPLAHATIRGINTSAAKSAPGVVAVFTGEDIDASGAVHQAAGVTNLGLAQPESLGDLVRVGENLFQSLSEPLPLPPSNRRVAPGFIEGSSVRPTSEMTAMIPARSGRSKRNATIWACVTNPYRRPSRAARGPTK